MKKRTKIENISLTSLRYQLLIPSFRNFVCNFIDYRNEFILQLSIQKSLRLITEFDISIYRISLE